VIVGALGYFVDIYDLILFPLVSGPSVLALGVAQADAPRTILMLLNWQMAGMLLGGFFWGVLGDKKGRLTVLFGSIALYSVANLLNAGVTEIWQYAALRFVAGVGLAGELGAAITLVSEVLHKDIRGYGTALVAGIGVSGAVVGGFVALLTEWRVTYLIGGALGIVLLITRMSMRDSLMFHKTKDSSVRRGDLRMLLANPDRASRFVRTTLVGLPIWCLIALFITISPFVAADLGISGINQIIAIQWFYGAAAIGGLFWGSLSQWVESRKRAVIMALTWTAFWMFVYFFSAGAPAAWFYFVCGMMGLGTGYWSIFVTMAAEQFGTNLRATVATTVPNLIRGSTVPIVFLFTLFNPSFGLARTAMVLGAACLLIALLSVRSLEEATPAEAGASTRAGAPRPLT
jgi:MFS transporter, putative metabolite:H+ symporter